MWAHAQGALSLDQAAARAAQHSPALAVAQADIAMSRNATQIALAKRKPTLSANGFATSGSYGSIYPPSSRVDPSYNLLVPSGALLDANVMLMVPLMTSGLLDSEVRSARYLEAAATFDFREVQSDAALRADDAYLRALLAMSNADAAKARAGAATELVRTTRAQFEAGKGIEASVLRAEAELAQAKRALARANGEIEKSLLDLRSEIGLDPETPLDLTERLDADVKPEELKASIAAANANRGAVLGARARVDSASADVRAAEGASKPQVYGIAMADAATQSMNRGGSVGVTVSIPLFDGGARRAETSRTRAMRDKSSAVLRQSEITVEKEVRQAYVDFATSESNVGSARESVRSALAAYDVTVLRVASGKGILIEQLDALQSLTQARADLAEALYERRIAYAKILRGTGAIVPQEVGK